jgi:hypothetical protein
VPEFSGGVRGSRSPDESDPDRGTSPETVLSVAEPVVSGLLGVRAPLREDSARRHSAPLPAAVRSGLCLDHRAGIRNAGVSGREVDESAD